MKKKLLPLAMLAGLAGAVGTAQAAHVNPDGLGQVLIYPYYTTLAGQHTDIHLVNTTNKTKAVKIRFLEGQNSQEVLDFHVYLSAYDHFSGVITVAADGASAAFKTNDTTCTVPAIPQAGATFVNYAYLSDAGTNDVSRTREGYVEVIEMGELGEEDASGIVTEYGTRVANFDPAHAAKHINGVPKDCSALVKAWGSAGGQWLADNETNMDVGTGGLYGFASVFNVAEGTSATYSATAIADFNTLDILHYETGDVQPSLADILPTTNIFDNATVVSDSFTNPIDAVSALLTRNTLQNDYVTEEALAAETDWVVTFPTKRFYMQPVPATGPDTNRPLRQPFTAGFTADLACEHIAVTYFDREEGRVTSSSEPVFSPRPPVNVEGWNLCTEVNVISFNDSNVLNASESLHYGLQLADGFDNGWATIDLTAAVPPGGSASNYNPRVVVGAANDYNGLPVAGFAVIKYSNGNVDGVLSNYAGVVEHKYTRLID